MAELKMEKSQGELSASHLSGVEYKYRGDAGPKKNSAHTKIYMRRVRQLHQIKRWKHSEHYISAYTADFLI